MTVLQALSLAGGFTTFASPRNMKIISGSGTRQKIREINYYKMIEDVGLGSYMLTDECHDIVDRFYAMTSWTPGCSA